MTDSETIILKQKTLSGFNDESVVIEIIYNSLIRGGVVFSKR